MSDNSNGALENKTLTTEREFDVPRELVWDAWTKPEHFAKWYAPDMFTVSVCEFDLRPEGSLRIDMKGPDGTVYPSSGVFKDIEKPELLSFTNSPLDSDGNKLFEVLHTLTLAEHGNKTKFNLVSKVISAGPDAAPYLAGMETGLNQAIEKLDGLLQELSK